MPVIYYAEMHRTIHLYIVREITALFCLGLSVFTMILLLGRIIKLTDLVISRGVSPFTILKMIAYLMPSFLVLTLPMAFLLAVLLAFGRLSSDSEITVMKACGIGLSQLFAPVAACAVFVSLLALAASTVGVPWGNNAFKQLTFDIIRNSITMTIKEKVFWDTIPGIVLYADHFDDATSSASGIFIHDGRDAAKPVTIFAGSGTMGTTPSGNGIVLKLANGSIHAPGLSAEYRTALYDNYQMVLQSPVASNAKRSEADLSVGELLAESKKTGISRQEQTKFLTELHSRFAFPAASLVFAAIGVPLGLQNRRSGKSSGFAVSIGLLLFYYILLSMIKTLADRGLCPPLFAVLTPNILLLLLGVQLFKMAVKEQSFRMSLLLIPLKKLLPVSR